MKQKRILSGLVLFALFGCSVKNNRLVQEQSDLHGSWEEYDRKGAILPPLVEPDLKWTITDNKIIDSSIYPIDVFEFEYNLVQDDIQMKNVSVLGDRIYKILRLTDDTLIIREEMYKDAPDSLGIDYYYKKVSKHTFDTIGDYYKVKMKK